MVRHGLRAKLYYHGPSIIGPNIVEVRERKKRNETKRKKRNERNERKKERKKKRKKEKEKKKEFQGILHTYEVQEKSFDDQQHDTDTLYSLTSLITYLPFDLKRKISPPHLFDPRFRRFRGFVSSSRFYLFVSLQFIPKLPF